MSASDRHLHKPSVALIGMRGCGKTTVGRELAALLHCAHIDTDDLIRQGAGESIADIFAQEGETAFRARELEAVRQAVSVASTVISVGGGAILDQRNVEALRTVATIVWLRVPAGVLWQRIAGDAATADSRPPLTGQSGPDEVRQLLAQRSQYYEAAADLILDAVTMTPAKIAARIAGKPP